MGLERSWNKSRRVSLLTCFGCGFSALVYACKEGRRKVFDKNEGDDIVLAFTDAEESMAYTAIVIGALPLDQKWCQLPRLPLLPA